MGQSRTALLAGQEPRCWPRCWPRRCQPWCRAPQRQPYFFGARQRGKGSRIKGFVETEWVTSQVCGKQRGESLCSKALVGEVCNKTFLHVTEGLRVGLASAFIPPPLPKAGRGKGRWVLPGWVVPAAQHGQGTSPPSPSSGTEAGGAVGWAPRSAGGARRGQRWRGPAEKRRKRELSAGECRGRPACRGAAGKGASSLYVQGFLPSPPRLPARPHRSLCRGDIGVVQARGSPLVRGPHWAVLPLPMGPGAALHTAGVAWVQQLRPSSSSTVPPAAPSCPGTQGLHLCPALSGEVVCFSSLALLGWA